MWKSDDQIAIGYESDHQTKILTATAWGVI